MLSLLIYIIVPSTIALVIMFYQKTTPGSDHAFHLNTINRIKTNGHRFIEDYLFSVNEKYPFYPQLYHWILSFLPEKLYREKYIRINITIKLLEIISFNAFLLYIQGSLGFKDIAFLYANIIFHSFPFSYAAWNAKNTGLSARGIGLVAGQIYLYLLIAYILSGSFGLLVPIFLIVFIILLMSQMALQFILLSLPFVVLVFPIPEIFPMPFIAYGVFYLMMPKVAKNYIIGQFNHKRNYALFMADIFILKSRPSIYRDFIYDFWVRLRADWRRGLLYIFTNPLVELVYGFVFLWFVVYVGFTSGFIQEFNVMYKLVVITLALFFLTSFRWTRFLGEPQRYVEFGIPIITILFSLMFTWQIIVQVSIGALLLSFIPSLVVNKYIPTSRKAKESNRVKLLEFISQLKLKHNSIFVSNDYKTLNYVAGVGYQICTTDLSRFYKDSKAFYYYHHEHDFLIISPYALAEYFIKYQPDFLIINTDFYTSDHIKCRLKILSLTKTFGQYELFSLK